MLNKYCVIVAAFAMLALCGCQPTSTADSSTPKVSTEDRIKEIQNNPNMPDNVKAAAIAQIRSGPQSGQSAKENAEKKK